MAKAEEIQQELQQIADDHGGLCTAPHVVEFAKDPETALHDRFEWDDERAGYQWRLAQARQIIRCYVQPMPAADAAPTRVFVSLRDDRHAGVGYRRLEDVMADPEMRGRMLNEARADMRRFVARYKHLEQLASVVGVMEDALDYETAAQEAQAATIADRAAM